MDEEKIRAQFHRAENALIKLRAKSLAAKRKWDTAKELARKALDAEQKAIATAFSGETNRQKDEALKRAQKLSAQLHRKAQSAFRKWQSADKAAFRAEMKRDRFRNKLR